MAISTQTMTPEQMKSVVIEYFKRFDRGGDVLGLFAEDADVYFPTWGVARGKAEIGRCFIYLDPDYAGADTERYHWLREPAGIPA